MPFLYEAAGAQRAEERAGEGDGDEDRAQAGKVGRREFLRHQFGDQVAGAGRGAVQFVEDGGDRASRSW